jgi:zinc protease
MVLSSLNLHKQILSNGLPVLLVHRPGERVVTLDAWVSVGSANEPPGIGGVSHFLEHMLFKGTLRRGVGEIDPLVESVGGYLNAATSHDFTHYYITVAADDFAVAADVLADVLEHSTLDPEELDRERQVILEEYARKQDDPQGFLWDALYERVFDQGPYKASVLGEPETLAAINHDNMLDYYHRHYAPSNLVLIVVGDVEPERALPLLEQHFAGFKRPNRPLLPPHYTPTVYARGVHEVIERDVQETYATLTFPAPSIRDHYAATYALDVLQFVLGGGNASRLYQEVKEKRRLATSISAGYSSSRHPDLFYVAYTCAEEKREELERVVLDELDRVRQTPVSPAELDRARKLLINAHRFSLETSGGQSGSIGYYYTVTGSPDFEWNYADGIRAVTAEQVQEQARRWLDPEKHAAMALRPKAIGL